MTIAAPRVVERIKKLLALARGRGDVNERAAASDRAAAMMAEHGLSEDDVRGATTEEIDVQEEDLPSWQVAVLQGCARVRGMALLRRTTGRTTTYRLVGTRAHGDETRYLHHLLVAEVERACHLSTVGARADSSGVDPDVVRRLRDSFKRGMARALQLRLAAADFRRTDGRVEEYLEKFHGQAEVAAPDEERGSPQAYGEGYSAGMRLDIQDPTEAARGAQRRLDSYQSSVVSPQRKPGESYYNDSGARVTVVSTAPWRTRR